MRRLSAILWPAAVLALPLFLLLSAVLTYRQVEGLKNVYLRDRAATIAARLEQLSPEQLPAALDVLYEEDPALVDLRVFGENDPADPTVERIRRGRELFRAMQVEAAGERLFRVYIPCHLQGRLYVARIDLALSAADFLVAGALRGVIVSALSGLVLLALSLYALWSARRAARLRQRQLELEHLARLGRLSAVLAHEIRNPLGTIKGFAQLATEKADAGMAALLDPVIAEVQRLEELVNHLLLYGRTPEPSLRVTQWRSLAGEIEMFARQAIGPKPILFVCARDDLRFRTDPGLLKQVLLNLVRNAVEALGDGPGEVRLAVLRRGRGLLLAVEDDGPGLPEEVRARLFEPFFTTKASGTGLGLSIARKLTSALGGSLELRPVEPRGTRAELVFPRMEVESGVPAWQPSS